MFMTRHSLAADEAVLLAALRDERNGWRTFEQHFRRFLFALARRKARELSPDLHEEIVQELLGDLSQMTVASYRISGKSPAGFVAGFASHAAQRVRAAYREPGQRSRQGTDRQNQTRRAIPVTLAAVSFEETSDIAIDVERCIAAAGPDVQAGMLVILAGGSMNDAANIAKMPRTSFARALRSIPPSLNHAA
jgi:hypothetical protein